MKKKIIALTLAVMMLCSTIFTHTVVIANAGGTEPTITVETVNAYRGDTDVTVNISISNNPGVVGVKLKIAYPSEKLELISAENTKLLNGWSSPSNFAESNPMTVTWMDELTDVDNESNGSILTLKFKVKDFEISDSLKLGLADITVSCGTYDICNVLLTPVEFQIVNGGINVACKHDGATYLKNEKPTSCFEMGYTGDKYCDICDEKIDDGEDIPKSSHSPSTDYSHNTTHHWKDCLTIGCGNEIDKEEHLGGTKTCTAQAICSVCNQPYGDKAPHTYTIPQKDADDHWNKCANCDAIDTKIAHTFDQKVKNANTLKDAADCDDDAVYYLSCTCGQISTTLTFVDTGSATAEHSDADGLWETDGTKHWHTCECSKILDEENHKGGTKTCTTQAICSVCNRAYGDLAPHSYTVPQKDADDHWNKCANCDAIDTKVTHTFDQKVKNTNTLKDAADCDEDAVYYLSCTCGQVSTTLTFVDTGSATQDHKDADGNWETNGTKHWHTCECGKILDEEDHKGGTATCKDQATCSVCQIKYGTTNANKHTGGTYLVGQKEPECYEKGYTGDTYCASCNVKIANGTDINESEHSPASVWSTNETHHWKVCEVIACGNIVDKDEHSGGAKTCTAQAICAVCRIPYGDKAPHTYTVPQKDADDHWNKCANCDAIDTKVAHTFDQKVKNANTLKDAADCDEDAVYYLSCTCGQVSTTLTFVDTGSATQDHKDADGNWEYNDTKHWHTCECSKVIDEEDHNGGTKTCTTQAVCVDCQQPYGDKAPHSYTVPQKDADNHWNKCANCDAIDTKVAHTFDQKVKNANTLKDAADCDDDAVYYLSCTCGQVSTTLTFVDTGSATGNHIDADGQWETDGTKHWHTCECSKILDEENHKGGNKTCTAQAICSVCNRAYGDKAPHTYNVPQKDSDDHWNKCANCDAIDTKVAHTFDQKVKNANTLKDAADCDEDAVYYLSCTCGQVSTTLTFVDTGSATQDHKDADGNWETDGAKHWHTCECSKILDEEDHKGGTATCTDQATCSVCNVKYGTKNADNHTGGTEIKDAVPVKCDQDGYTGDTYCKGCGEKIADGEPILKGHRTVKVPYVKETHEKDGNIEYYTCSGCDLLFSDQAATTIIALDDTVIEKGEHSYGESYEKDDENHWKQCACGNIIENSAHTMSDWTVTKEATKTEKGCKEKTCSVCGYKVAEDIPVLESNNDDKPNSPQTGDDNNLLLWVVLMFISVTCLTVITVYNKKRKHSR